MSTASRPVPDWGVLYPVFDLPKAHVKMLDDRERTAGYIAALREVVRPGSVVVDIGTGTGVFALAAARAGAARVYAIESGQVASTAESLFAGNDLANQITLIRGRSNAIDLPEPADVIVSEVIGREPLEQHVLEIVLDARERMLKPGGCLVPSSLRIHAMPVAIPQDELDRMDFTPAAVERWRSWYGMDFRPLLATTLRRVAFKDASALRRWSRLAAPVEVMNVDFATYTEPKVDTCVTGVADDDGVVNGVVVSFDLQLSEGNLFTTHPDRLTDSWRYAVFFPPPFAVAAGNEFDMFYRYGLTNAPPGIGIAAR